MAYWPSGDADDSGGAVYPAPPVEQSGAANWRLARIDGNGDSLLSLPDITTIAQHWQEQAAGYRIYRRTPDAVAFDLMPDPDDGSALFTIARSTTFPPGQHQTDPTRPVRYTFQDLQAQAGALGPGLYQYKIAAFDPQSCMEGPLSPPISVAVPASSGTAPWLTLSATPLEGSSPLEVRFDACGSIDPDGGILEFEWDWTGDGAYEYYSGSDPLGYFTYGNPGTYSPTLKATDDEGQSTLIHATVLVNDGYWVHAWGGAEDNQAVAVALDSKQNVYIATNLNSIEDGPDLGVISYSPGGNLRWVKSFGDLDFNRQSEREVPVGITVTPDDRIVVSARDIWTAQSGMFWYDVADMYLLALDTSGRSLWQRCWEYKAYQNPQSLDVTNAGNILLSFNSWTPFDPDMLDLIQEYSATGDLLWQKRWSWIYPAETQL